MDRIRLAVLIVLALAHSTCGGNSGASAVLPGTNVIGTWKLVGEPVVAKTDADLYNWIDGGAPKYMERGWVSSAYAEYRKDGESLQVRVSDMGTPENAEAMFSVDIPASLTEISYTPESSPGGRRPNAVIDLGKSDTYVAHAFSSRYYIEINIDVKTEAALGDLKAFVLEMIDRAR